MDYLKLNKYWFK